MMSSVHRNRPCGPCCLCKKEQPRYDHFSKFTVGEQRFLEQHFRSAIPNDSCLCRKHGKESKKYQSDPEYIPVWKKKKSIEATHSTTTSCIYPGYTATSYNCRIIMPSKEMLPIFSEALNMQGNVSICETHYQTIYQQSRKPSPCAGCGANPKSREGYTSDIAHMLSTISQTC